MTNLVVGGTSGLGLEIARILSNSAETIVTGRHDPKGDFVTFREFDLTAAKLVDRIEEFVAELPTIKTLVYAAGYYQEGTVTDLSEKQIEEMLDVGGRGLIYFVKAILEKQSELDELITITSTSQWTPRKLEPIYNFVKAGAGHISNSFAEDGRIKKVLVAGPAGMRTEFWEGIPRDDLEKMLDPKWVADQIDNSRNDEYKYKHVRILREPPRLEEVEKR